MKTSTHSVNRVRHSTSKPVEKSFSQSVSNRDKVAIQRQVREIRAGWSASERVERALMGAERRAQLCRMLFQAATNDRVEGNCNALACS